MTAVLRRMRLRKGGDEGWVEWDDAAGQVAWVRHLEPERWRRAHALEGAEQVVPRQDLEPAPVFAGRQVWGFADNYRPSGGGAARTAEPLLFVKPACSVVDEEAPVPVGALTARGARVWGEGELAVLLGSDAHPLGVTLANDVTMELPGYEEQDHHLPYFKGQPGFCPCSSFLLPLTVLDDYTVECFHDGELLRKGSRAEQVFSWDELWQWLTAWLKPAAGDLVLLGAPRRVRDRAYARPGSVYTTVLRDRLRLETRFA
jgi:2-keto-4-pentenoate hydratase/2-oxohepta-3-ene-1,7-dioic acid hydratase in catechol pathway